MFSTGTRIALIILAVTVGIYSLFFQNTNFKLNMPNLEAPVTVAANADYSYEEVFIQYVHQGTVQAQSVDTKVIYLFQPRAEDIGKFNVGSKGVLSFRCVKAIKPSCDPAKPDMLYVNSVPVELIIVKL